MKHSRIIFLTLISLLISPVVKAVDKKYDSLPMSTYLWVGSLCDSAYVSRIDFDNFDNFYLMDRALWSSAEHFDATIDSLVSQPDAIMPLTRRHLFKQAVDGAHEVGTKAMWSIGNELIYGALDDARLDKMCKAICKTVEIMDFDGVDVDWEMGIHKHFDRHAQLMTSLRLALDSLSGVTGKTYELSTALSIEARYPQAYRRQLTDAVDYINLMSYDVGGCLWRNYASHNTPLKLIADDVDSIWKGIPREKLQLGLANYGFIYTGIFPDEYVPQGENIGAYGKYLDFNQALPYIYGHSAWREVYDPVEQVSYFLNDKTHSFITIDTPYSIARKFDFAVEAGLGGVFWWEYAKDVVADNNGGVKWKHILIPDHKKLTRQNGLNSK